MNGPLEWGSVSFDCDSGQQSPVDVQSNDATKQEYDTALTLEFSSDDSCNYGDGEICGTLINNGRSLIFQVLDFVSRLKCCVVFYYSQS